MFRRNERQRAYSSSWWFFAIIVGIVAGLCIVLARPTTAVYPFSKYQSLESVQVEYHFCKAHAPPGFDCYVQPVMVSEQFLAEESKK